MGVYLEFIKKSYKQMTIYRGNSYIYFINNIVRLLIEFNVWYALIGNGKQVQGISLKDMITFVILNRIISSLTGSHPEDMISAKIQDGSISSDFLRPVSLKYYLLSEQIGENIYFTLFNTLPLCIIGGVFFSFKLPNNPLQVLLFILSIILGGFIYFSIRYILGLFCFWTKTAQYISWFFYAFTSLFSGEVVPLWFYPAGLRKVCNVLPFKLAAFEPISIYLGKYTTGQAFNVILLELFWIVVLTIIEKIIWHKAQRVVTIQGG